MFGNLKYSQLVFYVFKYVLKIIYSALFLNQFSYLYNYFSKNPLENEWKQLKNVH